MAHDEQDHVDGWQTYSNWLDDLRNNNEILANYEENPKFKSEFLVNRTPLDMFKKLWTEEKELKNELSRIFKNDLIRCRKLCSNRIEKSSSESAKMRELGNKSFKKGNYLIALNQYTQAIKYSPYPKFQQAKNAIKTVDQDSANNTTQSLEDTESNSLALALANRSAALYALTRYRLCLLDIELAIKYGYPEANMFKLLIRKIKCLHILSVWSNDVEPIKATLKNLMKKPDTKEYIKTEIRNMFEFIEQTQPEEMEKDELDVVDETTMKISNVSKSLTQAADCVEMSYDGDKGRYLLTNKDVSFGRLLIAEEPYVCNLAPQKRKDYCYNCFSKLYSCGLSCPNCTQVLYCSQACLDAKSEIHGYECNKFLDFQEQLGVSYLVPHIMFKINFDPSSIPIYSRKSVEKKSLADILEIQTCDWPDLVYKNDYAAVLSLMDHIDDYDYDELMGHCLTAVYLMIAFIDQYSPKIEALNDEQNQIVLGSLILKHLLQLQTNLISILDQNLQDLVSIGHSISEMRERPIGVGIYPTMSLLNHSCTPNILSIFHRNKFIARASSSLECGTEINYCYGPTMSRMSKKDRQSRLKEQYFFTCSCECCSKNKENESRALLCANCQGPVIYNQDMTNKCLKCGKDESIDAKFYLKQIQDLKTILDQFKESQSDDALKIKKLTDIEAKLQKLAYWRHPIFVQIKSDLIECAETLGNLDLALKYSDDEFNLCAKTYGDESYECIMTRLKWINLKWQNLYYKIEDCDAPDGRLDGLKQLKELVVVVNETRGKLKDLLASTNILGAESSFETELKFLSEINGSINSYLSNLEPENTAEKRTDNQHTLNSGPSTIIKS